ncbi:WxL domain-containing protein [Lactiplantibacillus nangangensis]|uniref:WxL domain-containing protein n=1 Tax=Lactiplantibacillus nangangensis TaxID=2559917 RepID=A0ABW1SGZ5_9LACO|nr:WxL domain-containing protein [Lactiplantibacillus nangangensis]
MKKASKQLLAIGAVLSLGLVISTTPASATISKPAPEKPGKPSGDAGTDKPTTTTHVDISLEASDNKITLVDSPTIDFKGTKIVAGKMNLTTNSIKDNLRVFNPGKADGYGVTARIAAFKDKSVANSEDSLKGARMTLKDRVITAEDTNNQSKAPIGEENVELNGDDKNVMTAKPGTGLGIFRLTYKDAMLEIPDGNKPGTYGTVITWTLTEAPKSN